MRVIAKGCGLVGVLGPARWVANSTTTWNRLPGPTVPYQVMAVH
jgi:hypothetical protein